MKNEIEIVYRDGVHPAEVVSEQLPLFPDVDVVVYVNSHPLWCNVYNHRARGEKRSYESIHEIEVTVV